MGSYTSAKGIKTYPSENWLETGSLMPVVTCGGRSTICCSWRATSIQVNCWRKDCTLFCPLALGLNERHLLHLVLRMQNFEVFEPAFCFWVTGLHSQVAVWEHLLSSWQRDGGKVETVADFIFLGSKITVNGDCSHKINRCLLLGRKAMIDLDSVLKSRGISVPTKVCIVKFMVSPVVMHRHESGTINTAEFLGLQGDQTHKS